MAIEIVDLPIKRGGSFHSYVSLPIENGENGDFPWSIYPLKWRVAIGCHFLGNWWKLISLSRIDGARVALANCDNYGHLWTSMETLYLFAQAIQVS
jgi:hypothetical protein